MHVVEQCYPSVDMKRTILFGCPYRFAQVINMPHQQILLSFAQIHDTKVLAAQHLKPSIIRHL
jgi:hypothetical protein